MGLDLDRGLKYNFWLLIFDGLEKKEKKNCENFLFIKTFLLCDYLLI